ncbi:sugar phosphate isomerase/epimerase family protein [Actibacterium lipolyticum]|uniref:Inosose isomerase n=1 Tax=Actibacterium lipolyticum TaxID=1524263 RepID=A0A238JL32_9RHOB|nr:sugar phosphate isomerase/epimerase [Actibacterium lipolyticum]SMX31351.1 Inosose isomerase [Actibacterium lipolyticum]
MNITDIELCASYWTVAGNTYPGAPSEISPFPLTERAEICGRTGWRGMGFVMDDMEASIDRYGLSGVRHIFADNNIRHVELEFLLDWHLTGERRAASNRMYARMLEISDALGVGKIKLGGGVFETKAPDTGAMRAALFDICEAAKPLGIDIVIEFLPFASINTIERGLDLFRDLGVSNGGLLVDTWHVQRGGMSAEDIRKIPTEFLRAAELDDAGPEVIGDLFNDSTHYRRPCGEGAIDIAGQIQAMLDQGYRSYWGVELISAHHRHLPLQMAATHAYDTTLRQFDAVTLPAD